MLDYIKYDSMGGYVGSWHGTLVWVTLDYYVPFKNKLNICSDFKCACSSLCIKNEAAWRTIECECKQHKRKTDCNTCCEAAEEEHT